MPRILKHLALLFVIVIPLAGCAPRGPKSANEASGEYVFRYQSGDVEVLILNENLTYRHELYQDAASYRQRGTVLYTNVGTWYYEGSRLNFREWMSFSADPKPVRINPPQPYSSWVAYWELPASGRDATILASSTFHYEFLRVIKPLN